MTKTNVQPIPSNSQHHDTPNNKTHVMTRWPGMQGTGFQAVKNSAFLLPA